MDQWLHLYVFHWLCSNVGNGFNNFEIRRFLKHDDVFLIECAYSEMQLKKNVSYLKPTWAKRKDHEYGIRCARCISVAKVSLSSSTLFPIFGNVDCSQLIKAILQSWFKVYVFLSTQVELLLSSSCSIKLSSGNLFNQKSVPKNLFVFFWKKISKVSFFVLFVFRIFNYSRHFAWMDIYRSITIKK